MIAKLGAPDSAIVLERPPKNGHGDPPTSLAIRLAKSPKRQHRQVARDTVVAVYGLNLLGITAPQRM